MLKEVSDFIDGFLQDRPTMRQNNSDHRRMSELLTIEVEEACEAVGTNELGQELVDVIWFAVSMAILNGVDLDAEFRTKAAYNMTRYRSALFQDGDYTEARIKIKAEEKDHWKRDFYQIPD